MKILINLLIFFSLGLSVSTATARQERQVPQPITPDFKPAEKFFIDGERYLDTGHFNVSELERMALSRYAEKKERAKAQIKLFMYYADNNRDLTSALTWALVAFENEASEYVEFWVLVNQTFLGVNVNYLFARSLSPLIEIMKKKMWEGQIQEAQLNAERLYNQL